MCANPARHRALRGDSADAEQAFWSAKGLVEGAAHSGSAKHARKSPSRYALHIGRVGALAVSLGVGLAIASSAGVAWAESDSDSGGDSGSAVLAQTGDKLGYIAPLNNPVVGTLSGDFRTVTLSGAATKDQYEEALKAVTFSATGGALLIRGLTVTVTDDTGVAGDLLVQQGVAIVNVKNPDRPLILTGGVKIFTIGSSATTLLDSATISDTDSPNLTGAVVKVGGIGVNNSDLLIYVQPAGSTISGVYTPSTQILVMSGTATKAQYEAALESIKFSTTKNAFGAIRTITWDITDDQGATNLVSGLSTISVLGLA